MIDLTTALGLVATLGLTLFYIPQVITAHRASTMRGFNIPAWAALWVAVAALVVQASLLGIWTAAAANVVGMFGVLYIIIQVMRKGS